VQLDAEGKVYMVLVAEGSSINRGWRVGREEKLGIELSTAFGQTPIDAASPLYEFGRIRQRRARRPLSKQPFIIVKIKGTRKLFSATTLSSDDRGELETAVDLEQLAAVLKTVAASQVHAL
jgi:hypothetical protein